MKVCTDASLFGAWCVKKMNERSPGCKNILDIGTGTGLLSLMAAQKTEAIIDAVEIDSVALKQAENNFLLSPWNNKLNALHASINNYKIKKRYDFIICNPPFYKDSFRSANNARNAAMHDRELTLEELTDAIKQLLHYDGFSAVLLPYSRTGYFVSMASNKGLYLVEKAQVKQTRSHNYFRSMLLLSGNKKNEIIQEEISIRDDRVQYTREFTALLKDYYLYL